MHVDDETLRRWRIQRARQKKKLPIHVCETTGCRKPAAWRVENPSGAGSRCFWWRCEKHAPPEKQRTPYNTVAIEGMP